LGWNKSCTDVKVGAHCTIPWPKWPWNSTVRTPVAAVRVYSAPDDGRKGRPKHVGHTCSC